MKIVALAGGVGGAKLVDGLSQVLPPDDLKVIVNTGDDFELYGLRICPDLDTVCYTLAGKADPIHGWGRNNETWNVYEAMRSFGMETWFKIGDKDLGLHLLRTSKLTEGKSLTQATNEICLLLGIVPYVFPMCDEYVNTMVNTLEYGWLPFQEYFVKYRCEPTVKEFKFNNIDKAQIIPEVQGFIRESDAIVICPSNPWVSIDPILKIQDFHELIRGKRVIAISPIIAGKTIKGPAAKMFLELGIEPSAVAVARHYQSILTHFVIDKLDSDSSEQIKSLGIIPINENTIMKDRNARKSLAQNILNKLIHLI